MIDEAAIAELKKPLDAKNVASRKQGGGQVSYIEGWHAIAEANRIFGFDAWTRETVEMVQLGEPYQVNGNWRVNYRAKVRVVATGSGINEIIREGCGFGQGIDKDVGQAHESALKEAETDAMKRALMTFGNPFGLALYDKSRANVDAGEPSKPAEMPDAEWATLVQLVEASNADTTAMLKHYGVKSLRHLNQDQYGHAVNSLKSKLAAMAKDDTNNKAKEAA